MHCRSLLIKNMKQKYIKKTVGQIKQFEILKGLLINHVGCVEMFRFVLITI